MAARARGLVELPTTVGVKPHAVWVGARADKGGTLYLRWRRGDNWGWKSLRVRLDACPPGLVERLGAIAPRARFAAGELVIPAPPASRAAALELVRASGAEIRGLTAEEGGLDALYRELAGASA